MTLFVSNNLIGWIGGFYGKMPPFGFWAMHVAIAIVGALVIALFGRRLSRVLRPGWGTRRPTRYVCQRTEALLIVVYVGRLKGKPCRSL
jgi:hypothetical protein